MGQEEGLVLSAAKTPPWKRKKNTGGPAKKLTPEQLKAARERAAAHKRRYPNLVDNIWASRLAPQDLARKRDPDNFDPDA